MLKHRQTRGKPTGKHLAATVAAFGMLLLTFLLTSQSAFAAGPALSASKTSGIAAAGETITVTGSGFSANTNLFLAVCNPAVPSGGACDLTNFKQVTTTATGTLSTPIKVVAKFGTTDCTKVSCVLMTNEPANPTATTNVATLAISFAAAAAPTTAAPATSAPTAAATTSAPPAAAPALPKGTDAGQADTGNQLTTVAVLAGAAVVLLAAGGVLYVRRREV